MLWHELLYPEGETNDCDQHDYAACNMWCYGFHICIAVVIELLMMYQALFKQFESRHLYSTPECYPEQWVSKEVDTEINAEESKCWCLVARMQDKIVIYRIQQL